MPAGHRGGWVMKVAVSSTGKELESAVDQRFGRADYLVIVDTDVSRREI